MYAHVGGHVCLGVVVRDSSTGKRPGEAEHRYTGADARDDSAPIPNGPDNPRDIRVVRDTVGIPPGNKHADAVAGVDVPGTRNLE